MAQATTSILLSQTPGGTNNLVRGTKQPAAAYYSAGKDLQTISWSLTNVTCVLIIQASIVENPNEANDNDWFDVYENVINSGNGNGFTNVNGNFVWIRAKLTGFTTGVVQYVRMSY